MLKNSDVEALYADASPRAQSTLAAPLSMTIWVDIDGDLINTHGESFIKSRDQERIIVQVCRTCRRAVLALNALVIGTVNRVRLLRTSCTGSCICKFKVCIVTQT